LPAACLLPAWNVQYSTILVNILKFCLSPCPSGCLSASLSVCLSFCLPAFLPVCLSVCPYICIFIFVPLSFYNLFVLLQPACLPVPLSVRPRA
jgi:hypothetical protein